MKLERISDEVVENTWGGWRLPDGVSLERVQKIAQAQLDHDQEQVDELVGEIFSTLNSNCEHSGSVVLDICCECLQALKQKCGVGRK